MDFQLTEDLVMLQKMVREFAQNEVAPKAQEWDEKEEFPWENVEKMKELDLLGIVIPQEYGGTGMSMMEKVIVQNELAKVDASTAGISNIHNGSGTLAIVRLGTKEQKERYLPDMAKGNKLAAICITEPGAGSDAASMETSAVEQGDHYVLNGTKCFISLAGVASVFTVLARMDPNEKRGKGIGAFIVEKDFPGLSVDKAEVKAGLKGNITNSVVFTDCIVPKENLLVSPPDGFRKMMTIFNGERIGNSSISLGIAEGAMGIALKYVQQREAFGKKIVDFQGIRWILADMAKKIEASRLLVYQAAWLFDNNLPFIKAASIAKLFCNETAMYVTNEAIHLLGGYGYVREYEVERMMRDAKGYYFGAGTPHIQKDRIAYELLKNQ